MPPARLPKEECCLDRPRCKRCPIRALAEGTLPAGYTVRRRRLVRVEDAGEGPERLEDGKKKAGKKKDGKKAGGKNRLEKSGGKSRGKLDRQPASRR